MELNENQLKHLEEKYGEILRFSVDDVNAYIRKPNETEYFMFIEMLEKEDKLAVFETMLESLWIDGDESIKENDEYFIGLSFMLEEQIFKTIPLEMEKQDDKVVFTYHAESGQTYTSEFSYLNRKQFFEVKNIPNLRQMLDYIYSNCKIKQDDIFNQDVYLTISLKINLTNLIKYKSFELKKN